jgi:hypothetical protein
LKHTRKHERKERGIEPRSKATKHWRTVRPAGADCLQWPRRQSGQVPPTVRKSQQNHQRRTGKNGLSARNRRTVRIGSGPSATEARTVRKPAATKSQNKTGSKAKTSRNTMNTRRTLYSRTVCQAHADCPLLTDRSKNSLTPRVNSSNTSPDLPNGRSSRDKGLGTRYASNNDAIPQNFRLLTP